MAGKSNWLMGCGIGCLAVVVLLAVGGVLTVRTGKRVVARLDAVGDSQRELADRFGAAAAYAPPADGTLAADRIELFLGVQDSLQDVGSELAGHGKALKRLEHGRFPGPGGAISGFRSVIGMGRAGVSYLERRNRMLMRAGMGMGEYTYLDVICYYSLLGKPFSPVFGKDDSAEERCARLQDLFAAWIRNQRDAAAAAGASQDWLDRLDAEVLALKAADVRVPWAEGLPGPTAASLAPFRARIEATYLPLAPLVGVGIENEHGGFSFSIE